MHQIRQALRGKGTILMGKNTMVRRAVRLILADNPQFERFLPHVKGNVGFVFTNAPLKDIRDIILANKVAAPAKAGAWAPNDVWVPGGNTGMEPGKVSLFILYYFCCLLIIFDLFQLRPLSSKLLTSPPRLLEEQLVCIDQNNNSVLNEELNKLFLLLYRNCFRYPSRCCWNQGRIFRSYPP